MKANRASGKYVRQMLKLKEMNVLMIRWAPRKLFILKE